MSGDVRRIRKLLIANRGEVALRIMRTCMEMGIISVAVYEKPDKDSFFVRAAGESVLLGDGPVKDYLDIDKIIAAAKEVGADAIHPGYGFLSENPDLARACEREDIIFVGPNSEVLRAAGDKLAALRTAQRAGVPTIPSIGPLSPGEEGLREAVAFAGRFGYPVMIKAVSGGGGRGIRKVASETELRNQLPVAAEEARTAFGDPTLYVEKCIEQARHVEVQILADKGGRIVHLGTRDCSIQRRNQKILEIAPATLPLEVTRRICAAALRIGKEAKYTNAGTVEFLVDRRTNEFWFMEINARLQVEHTVTEEITGVDIVRQQIWIAEGEALDLEQDRLQTVGRAIQVRINAEDPRRNFMPDAGLVVGSYQAPGGPGVRLDGIVYPGYRIPSEYDSLLVKLTVRGFNWEQAVDRLHRALRGFTFSGVRTTIPLYLNICHEADFRSENFGTDYLDTHPELFRFEDDAQYLRDLDRIEKGEIRSPVKGVVRSVLVHEGDVVVENDVLMTIESMKMICNIYAETGGRVEAVYRREGEAVDYDELLVLVKVV